MHSYPGDATKPDKINLAWITPGFQEHKIIQLENSMLPTLSKTNHRRTQSLGLLV